MTRVIVSGVLAGLIAVTTPAPAGAITYDKLTYMTFSGSVQIPGATLDAGTYRFALANSETSRNVLHVLSANGEFVYAMFHTVPDMRVSTTSDPVVTFRETPVGVAPAVKSLFYGGESMGYEFVYPPGGPNMIPKLSPQPPITYSAIPVPAAMPESIAEPEAAPAAEPTPTAEPAAPAPAPLPWPEPVELPRTATSLPLFAMAGLTSVLGGLVIGLVGRRIN